MSPEDVLFSNAVAVTWGYRVLGSAGWIMSVFVCLSTIGALNGSCVTGGRLPFVAARNGHLPEVGSGMKSYKLSLGQVFEFFYIWLITFGVSLFVC